MVDKKYQKIKDMEEKPVFTMLITGQGMDNSSVRYVVEGESHQLYEVRFTRIQSRGDASSQMLDIELFEEDSEDQDDEEQQSVST